MSSQLDRLAQRRVQHLEVLEQGRPGQSARAVLAAAAARLGQVGLDVQRAQLGEPAAAELGDQVALDDALRPLERPTREAVRRALGKPAPQVLGDGHLGGRHEGAALQLVEQVGEFGLGLVAGAIAAEPLMTAAAVGAARELDHGGVAAVGAVRDAASHRAAPVSVSPT